LSEGFDNRVGRSSVSVMRKAERNYSNETAQTSGVTDRKDREMENHLPMRLRACRTARYAQRASPLRLFGLVLVLAALLSSVTAALAETTWLMVPGAGVGRVTLGMKGADAIAILGRPTAYCVLSASGDREENVMVLYYSNRGLALTLSSSRSGVAAVARIHVVAGYSATLSDEAGTGANWRGYRKCSPHGTLTLDVPTGAYATSGGIRPGSSEADVVAKFGAPKVEYPAVTAAGDHAGSSAEMESLLLHRRLLLPYRARVLAYDGIILGIYDAAVVALTIDWIGFDPYRHVVALEPRTSVASLPFPLAEDDPSPAGFRAGPLR
jgi:hypothetical protein